MKCSNTNTTEQLPFPFSLSCIGEGNGNPLQCSCLENPKDGGAWWAALYGVAQSWTRLKRLSSSSIPLSECFTDTLNSLVSNRILYQLLPHSNQPLLFYSLFLLTVHFAYHLCQKSSLSYTLLFFFFFWSLMPPTPIIC